jgi:hypothetical protein
MTRGRRPLSSCIALAFSLAAFAPLAGGGCAADADDGVGGRRTPTNVCASNSDCAPLRGALPVRCQSGRCVSDPPNSVILAVDLPDRGARPGRMSMVVSYADALERNPCRFSTTPSPCFRLPRINEVSGAYLVAPSEAQKLGTNLGLLGLAASIPVDVTIIPLVPDSSRIAFNPPGSAAALNAEPAAEIALRGAYRYGLSMPPRRLRVDRRVLNGVTGPRREDELEGDRPTNAFVYEGFVPELRYVRVMQPQPPFVDTFPPVIESLGAEREALFLLSPSRLSGVAANFRQAVLITLPVDPPSAAEGFTAWLEDDPSGTRISTIGRVVDGRVSLAIVRRGDPANDGVDQLRNVALVLDPPPEVRTRPRLRRVFVAEQFTIGRRTASVTRYPPLPTPVRVRGTVRDAAGGRAVDLTFRSQPFTPRDESGIRVLQPDSPTRFSDVLSFERRIATDEDGRFDIALPPGTYDVVARPIVPHEAAPPTGSDTPNGALVVREPQAGLTTRTLVVEPGVRQNADVVLSNRRALRGRALLVDGRLLDGAMVEARPATAFVARGEPQFLWPLLATARTAADGRFWLSVDPGVYDVTVRPPVGSGFAPVVVTNVVVGEDDVDLPDESTQIAAPILLRAKANDSTDVGQGAVTVRAFMLAPRKEGADEQEFPPAFVQVAQTVVESADDAFELLFLPPR